ncbi:hypothetical protein DPMN_160621 [Dreissena polymorpha]|uniref:Uncharacterized protein n=1 Tax=Dreissena polymorpha TaxID=45954 RepID=A0A9D4ERK5_DREPO|nr:hypothetical protein DPMN_160621 [Dreissena polymorpha]
MHRLNKPCKGMSCSGLAPAHLAGGGFLYQVSTQVLHPTKNLQPVANNSERQ